MLKVIPFVTQKGGSGKTTLCVNLCVHAIELGRRCLLADSDPQKTGYQWWSHRKEDAPKGGYFQAGELEPLIELARRDGFDYVFVDTAGHNQQLANELIKLADLVLIPCRPTVPDMDAQISTVDIVRRLEGRALIVLNQCLSLANSSRPKQTRQRLSHLNVPVAPTSISSLVDFQDSFVSHEGVTELNPRGKAAAQIRELWASIEAYLQEVRTIASTLKQAGF